MKPKCMDDAEYREWSAYNESIVKVALRAPTPCVDCPRWFADEMRAIDMCDGVPGRKCSPAADWPSRSPEYQRVKQREYRRRKGQIDIAARTEAQVARAVALRDSGLRNIEIARAMGVERNTVSRYLKRAAA